MPESKDDELSMDELKDVNGGINWDRPETASGVTMKGKKVQMQSNLGGLGCNAGGTGGHYKKGQIKDGIADRHACNDNLPG